MSFPRGTSGTRGTRSARQAAFLAITGAASALAIFACVGDDPAGSSNTQDGGGSSGSSGTSSGSSGASGGTSGASGGTSGNGDSGTSGSSGSSGSSGTSGSSGSSGGDAAGAMLAFVTNGEFDGMMGGVAQADMYCQTAALNGNLPGGAVPGSYLAWIASDTTDQPSTRFTKSPSGYKRTDGVLIAATWNDLVSGSLLVPISLTELKVAVNANSFVWTNVDKTGAVQTSTTSCTAWTSTNDQAVYGDTTQVGERWTNSTTATPPFKACSSVLHLFCFQQK